ncbi:MAG: type II secretion system F family protein [Geobacter sp.]|nr:type II secretion system F family protein [Geobacter sp.]
MLPIILLTFCAIFLATFSIYLGFAEAKDSPRAILKRRLRHLVETGEGILPDELKADLIKETTAMDRFIAGVPALRKLERLIDQAGLKISPIRFLLIPAILLVIILLIAFIIKKFLLAMILIALFVPVIPFIYLSHRKKKREEKFTEQLPDALTMLARSLRAGHSLTGAVELVGTEMQDPLGELFKTAYEQQKLGLRVTDSMQSITERIESIDLRFMVTALSINAEVGGNLAEILDKLAETIRERLRIRRQVRVYTAQGRMSGYILAALPIVTFILFNILMPGYEDVLVREKVGNYVLAFAALMQIMGFLFIRKIINIRI